MRHAETTLESKSSCRKAGCVIALACLTCAIGSSVAGTKPRAFGRGEAGCLVRYASGLYHDCFWYPLKAKQKMKKVLASSWGRLFRNWEHLTPDERGFPEVGEDGAVVHKAGWKAFWRSFGILGTTLTAAPEFIKRKTGVTSPSQCTRGVPEP